ncbi:MAG TPA: TIGR03087 family PEP-CTERM/XrtA system glycosyltransferase [Novosphingobium sp.]
MREILFIAHRIPFPPDRGDKIRSHHVLKRLSRLAPVHVATFADDDFDIAEEVELAALASSYKLVRRIKPLVLAGVQALAGKRPVSLAAFHDHGLAQYVEHVLATRPISTIYVFSGQMGQYVPSSFKGRVVVDFVDVDSAKFEAYAKRKTGIMRWIDAREGVMLRAEETRLAGRADISLLISRQETDLFASRLPESVRAHARVEVLGNGIDGLHFDPALIVPEKRMMECEGPRLIFTGQMDYAPNIDAVLRAMDRIVPQIRREIPGTTFHVVGRNPVAQLLERHGEEGCHVWGRVDDVRPWLKAADVALVPLEIGRGVQNKVLEAMAMARPVVLTPEAATGIGARHGTHFAVGEDDADMIGAVLYLLRDQRQARSMGQAARHFILEEMSWQSALASLSEMIGWQSRAVRDAA